MTVRESWTRIEAWVAENAPALRKSLWPAVKEGAIEKLQTRLGLTLPADFADSLRIHDARPHLWKVRAADSASKIGVRSVSVVCPAIRMSRSPSRAA